MTRTVSTEQEARELAAYLLDPDREPRVVVVTSTSGKRAYPRIDALERAFPDEEIVSLEGPAAGWAFGRAMPEGAGTFGGAARVYDADRAPAAYSPRIMSTPSDFARVVDALRRDLNHARGVAFSTDSNASIDAEEDGVREELAAALRRIAQLEADLRSARSERTKAESRARQREQAAARSASTSSDDADDLFLDPDDLVRYLIQQQWVRQIPATMKADLPLPRYVIGPDFSALLLVFHADKRRKALREIVNVLIGQPTDAHPLRRGYGGEDPVYIRESDGAVAWRSSIETNVPSARRLHWWKAAVPELSRVAVHDDMRP